MLKKFFVFLAVMLGISPACFPQGQVRTQDIVNGAVTNSKITSMDASKLTGSVTDPAWLSTFSFSKLTDFVTSYGATGDGTTSDDTAIDTGTAWAVANGNSLKFPGGTYRINSNKTVPDGVQWDFAPGAKIKVMSGATVTFLGSIYAPPTQIFDLSGGGTVTFSGNTRITEFKPEWWGFKTTGDVLDGNTNSVALQAASDAVGQVGAGTVLFQNKGVSYLAAAISCSNDTLYLGAGRGKTILRLRPTTSLTGISTDTTQPGHIFADSSIFPSGIAGNAIAINGAGPSGDVLITTVASRISDTEITVSGTASATVTGKTGLLSPDSHQDALAGFGPALRSVFHPITTRSNVTFLDLTMDGNMNNNLGARIVVSDFTDSDNIVYRNVEVMGSLGHLSVPGVGIGFGGNSVRGRVTNCYLHDLGIIVITPGQGKASDAVYSSGSYMQFDHNRVKDHTDTAFVCESKSTDPDHPSTDNIIDSNVITGGGQAIGIDSYVFDNDGDGTPETPGYGARGIITNNTIDGGAGANGAQIFCFARKSGVISSVLSEIVIKGNTVANSSNSNGIYVENLQSVIVDSNTVTHTANPIPADVLNPPTQKYGILAINCNGVIFNANVSSYSGGWGMAFLGVWNGIMSNNSVFENDQQGGANIGNMLIDRSSTYGVESMNNKVSHNIAYGTNTYWGLAIRNGSLNTVVDHNDFRGNVVSDGISDLSSRAVTGLSITSSSYNLTSAASLFSAFDVGTTVSVPGAGVTAGTLSARITVYNSPTSVTISTPAGTTVSSVAGTLGTNTRLELNQSVNTAGTFDILDKTSLKGEFTLGGIPPNEIAPSIKLSTVTGTGGLSDTHRMDITAGTEGLRILHNDGATADVAVLPNGSVVFGNAIAVFGNEIQFRNASGVYVSSMKSDITSGLFDIRGGSVAFRITNNAATFANLTVLDAGTVSTRSDFSSGGTISSVGNGTIGGVLTVTGSRINFPAGGGSAPFIRHSSNMMDITGGTTSFRVLNNAGTVVNLQVNESGTVISTGASITSKRRITSGTSLVTGDWVATGWGASAVVTVTGNDSAGIVTVTTNAADTPSANPTLVLTFKDGTWVNAPVMIANMNTSSTGPVAITTTGTNATTGTIRYNATPTPTTSLAYSFNYQVSGK